MNEISRHTTKNALPECESEQGASCNYSEPITNSNFSANAHQTQESAYCDEIYLELLCGPNALPSRSRTSSRDKEPLFELVKAEDIRPEPITWLWQGWLAAGKLHILAGSAGTGKTTIALDLAATITNGGTWPDGSVAPQGDVLIWSGEDDHRDTLMPRLSACGADLSRAHFITGQFDPARDIEKLREEIDKRPVKLLIIDPIVSAVGADTHKNGEVRRALQPLVDLAKDLRCAVLGITHFSKGTAGSDPLERVTGSLAFGAVARVVFVAAKISQSEHEDMRVLARAKSNFGPDAGGFQYQVEVIEIPSCPGVFNTRVTWGQAVKGTARDLLAPAGVDQEMHATRANIIEWLREVLADGPVPAKEMEKLARDMGVSMRTLQRLKSSAGVVSHKTGFGKGAIYTWQLKDDPRNFSCTPCTPTLESGEHGQHDGVDGAAPTDPDIPDFDF